jgi:hypothetical protein
LKELSQKGIEPSSALREVSAAGGRRATNSQKPAAAAHTA